jgi:hypothetical protein
MGIYVNNKQFFHVARTVPYNSYDDFERGMELEVLLNGRVEVVDVVDF